MDKDGVLLASKGFVVSSRDDLVDISQRGGGLFIDITDSEEHHRAYVDRLYGMVSDDKAIGEIAGAKLSRRNAPTGQASDREEGKVDWLDLQVQANSVLRDSNPATFIDRMERLLNQLVRHTQRNPDGTLFALIHLSASETRMYSATHAMLVSVMCGMASREVLKWPPAVEALLCKAAFTMNVGMTEFQDKLSLQVEPLSAAQRAAIDGHAEKSVQLLEAVGVTDQIWLQAVREHHTQAPGPLRDKTPAQRLARLIQRADMFAARLAPRTSRTPIAPAAAMQACYFDENRQVDEAGAALIKAVGIYQPGAFVKLVTDEVAVVIRRGKNTATPKVAVLVNRHGIPTVEPTIRDTSLAEFRIVSSVAHRDVKVKINLERFLPLTLGPVSDRPW